MQVTYNGWPLYHWAKDQKPGDTTGQGVGGVWYLISPKGEEIEVGVAPAATPAASNPTPQAAAAAMVNVATADPFGQFLTDDKGMTLYMYTKDTKDTSNCYDKCAAAWPPLYTEGAPAGGEGIDASLLGTTTRTDGKMQVTYNGWPLYHWAKDQKPGDTTGQGVGGVWYLISPKGEEIEVGVAPAATPAASNPTPEASQGQTVPVTIKDFAYSPKELTVAVGTTVTWTNEDTTAHTVTADNGTFDSKNMDQGATFSFTFTQAGTFAYYCTYHGGPGGKGMSGTVIVQ